MPLPIAIIRYSLILLPASGTMLAADIDSPGPFIAFALGCLLLARIGDSLPVPAALFLPAELILFGLFAHTWGGMLYMLLGSSLAAAAVRFESPRSIASFIAAGSAVLAAVLSPLPSDAIWLGAAGWLTAAGWAAAYWMSERQRRLAVHSLDRLAGRREQLEAARRRMADESRHVERHAQAEERARIARELHDDLGHRLIRLKMMMEASLPLLERRPSDAREMLEQVRMQLETAMDNMRVTVRKLKPVDDSVRRYALDRLIEDAARDLRIAVTFEMTGRPVPLYPSLEYALYRNAQEAITNAVRHGGASTVDVELHYGSREIRMTVVNNGSLPPDAVRHGLGLRGMEERAAQLGGTVRISTNGQFSVTTAVPYLDTAAGSEGVNAI